MITNEKINEVANKINTELLFRTKKRLIARKINEIDCINDAIQAPLKLNRPYIGVYHGGTVCNNYGHLADTESTVIFADAEKGLLFAESCRIAANKTTDSGILAKNIGEFARPYRDNRFSLEKSLIAKNKIIEYFTN